MDEGPLSSWVDKGALVGHEWLQREEACGDGAEAGKTGVATWEDSMPVTQALTVLIREGGAGACRKQQASEEEEKVAAGRGAEEKAEEGWRWMRMQWCKKEQVRPLLTMRDLTERLERELAGV